jgi:hypothetical protein
MLLGINAHVQNDMPFVIAALGVRQPDGTSRKPDHDLVNEVLNRGYEPVVEASTEAAREQVANQIEANAAGWANGIAATKVPGIRASRDSYCAKQLGL